MDKSLQKKLVGAAVLIALAVIFLPMLLNGKKEAETITMNIEIPPKPTYEVPNHLEPVVTTEQVATLERPAELAPLESLRPAATGITEVPASQAVQQAPVAAAPVAQPKPAKPAEKAPVKVAKLTPTKPAAAPAKASPAASGAGYVVQVGSFGKQENAERLKDKLAAVGFPAFVEKTQREKGAIFRVKVGPRTSRGSVDELRIRLHDEAKLEGIIVSHP